MNIALWIAASALALLFGASGATKLALPRAALVDRGYAWATDFTPRQVQLIGCLEVLGAVGLVVPPALHVAEVLSPLAGLGLGALMTGAVVVHVRRQETAHLAVPLVLAVLPLVLAALRLGPYGF